MALAEVTEAIRIRVADGVGKQIGWWMAVSLTISGALLVAIHR